MRGPVTSPTFVIARQHPSLRGGPDLVHADAYRLGSRAEVDDLDLDTDVATSVTVVEWGEGLVEDLAPSFLQIAIAPNSPARGSARAGHPVEVSPVISPPGMATKCARCACSAGATAGGTPRPPPGRPWPGGAIEFRLVRPRHPSHH